MTLEQIQIHWAVDPIHSELRLRWITVAEYTILAVAVVSPKCKKWVVYMKGVPGQNHELEWLEVRRHGSAVIEAIAQLIFPGMPEELEYGE
jgi:hypothetical protein